MLQVEGAHNVRLVQTASSLKDLLVQILMRPHQFEHRSIIRLALSASPLTTTSWRLNKGDGRAASVVGANPERGERSISLPALSCCLRRSPTPWATVSSTDPKNQRSQEFARIKEWNSKLH